NEVEKGESTWTPSHDDPQVQPKATATDDQLVAFGAYTKTVAPNAITTAFKKIKIDDVTGRWVEEETERKDNDGNVIGKTVCKYDIQTGYYVYEVTENGETTVTKYAKEGNKFFLVQEIQWIILKDLGDSYLLVSRELLDAKPMLDSYGQGTWEESTLRDWLNGTDEYARGGEKFVESWNFFDRAFNETERTALISVTNTTADNDSFGTSGGNTTTDLVYTFSAEELDEMFGDISKQAATTPYAAKRGVVAEYKTRLGSWWLRSSGISTYFQGVDRSGSLAEGGYVSNDKTVGVRPVITVAKSAVRTIDTTLPTAGPIETPTPRPTAKPTETAEG
ncbi:MAG: hypothetical protein J6X19_01890, partial [Clostridia bacterium]|nr:hypothetical protein [Clostridia bacterium]